MDEIKNILNKLIEEWNKAEEALKHAENIQGEVVASSINELRYAGRKIIEALSLDDNKEQSRRLLDDAIFDCMRARHDAIDAITAYISDSIDNITNELGVDVVLTCYHDLPKLLAEIGRIQGYIAHSRENRLNRDAIYETLQITDLPNIISMYLDLKSNESLMTSLAEKRKRERRYHRIGFWSGLIIGIIGLIIGILGLYY